MFPGFLPEKNLKGDKRQQTIVFSKILGRKSRFGGRPPVAESQFRKINLREARDENFRVLSQIRITGSLPIIYQELTEEFQKFFKVLVVMLFV